MEEENFTASEGKKKARFVKKSRERGKPDRGPARPESKKGKILHKQDLNGATHLARSGGLRKKAIVRNERAKKRWFRGKQRRASS